VKVVTDSKHSTALVQAAIVGHCDIVQLLLDAGATIDAEQQHMVVTSCCSDLDDTRAAKVVSLLLPHCSSFADNSYELGNLLLTSALSEGKLQVAQLLHAAGADVHYSDEYGTVIHYAAAGGSVAIVKWLESFGLDLRAVSVEEHMLPLHWACQHDHVQMIEYFLSLPEAASDVHACASGGQTPLHYAANSAADSVVQLLLQRGVDVDARDDDCTTPLMCANSLSAVKLLLAAGADATAVDTSHNKQCAAPSSSTWCVCWRCMSATESWCRSYND
jgi:ankyrin repeat protein